MLSEEFDKKVKEAADHHYPSYDEKAWEKMEKLLNKHLPQKKDDRRKYILFLLLFLLTGGGAYLMIAKPWRSNKPLIVADKKIPQNVSGNTIKDADAGNSEKINNKNSIDINKAPIPGQATISGPKKQQGISAMNTKPEINKTKLVLNTGNPFLLHKNKSKINPLKDDEVIPKNNKAETIDGVTGNNIVNLTSEKTAGNKNTDEQKLNISIITDSTQKKTEVASVPAAKKTKANNKKGNSFFLSLSAGPDLSFAGLGNLGKIKLIAGAGIGYTFKNKFTLRTGFYSARKIYTAESYQYHTTATTWGPNYTLDRVDADCRVYEIPLLLSYNFSHSARQSLFATIGISSYLMKKETYDYQYKNPSGQVYTHQWTLKDKNKHYFSVFTLSGGYQRNISKTFSIMAEPYLKIPMAGIGFGKVKLNSAGILLSVGIKPFSSGKAKAGN